MHTSVIAASKDQERFEGIKGLLTRCGLVLSVRVWVSSISWSAPFGMS